MNKKNKIIFPVILIFIFSLSSNLIAQNKERSIDVVLLIDGSGSMSWPDRDPDGLRLQGAKLFVDLCENNDRIGVIEFSTDANINFPLYKITNPRDIEELKKKIEPIQAKGKFTDITLALETALREMSRARNDSVKAVILLTDGEIDPDPSRETFAPYNEDYLKEINDAAGNQKKISEIKEKYKDIVAPISREILKEKVLPKYKEQQIPVFTVAFGNGADKSLLIDISDLTANEIGIRNFYFIEQARNIQPVFSEILEQLKKSREKVIEKEIQFKGKEIIHKINIDDFIREVNFKFIFSRKILPSEVQISLEDPQGNIITRETKSEEIGHIFEEGYELYNIYTPIPGTWNVIIEGQKDVKLDITISTWGRTELKILKEEMKAEYNINEPIPILASLYIEDKRVASEDFLNNLKFKASIENPDQEVIMLDLYDDGNHSDKNVKDGIYGNIFYETSIPGDYIIKIVAQGLTVGMKRFNFTRETEYRVRVSSKEKVPTALIKERPETPEKKEGISLLKITLFVLGALVILLIVLFLMKNIRRPSEEEEILSPHEELFEMFSPTIKIKDQKEKIVGSKQIKHPSIGEKNLVIRRDGEEFFIYSIEGTLELNNRVVTEEEAKVNDEDIIKMGELFFEVQLKPEENKVSLLGIPKEQAEVKIRGQK